MMSMRYYFSAFMILMVVLSAIVSCKVNRKVLPKEVDSGMVEYENDIYFCNQERGIILGGQEMSMVGEIKSRGEYSTIEVKDTDSAVLDIKYGDIIQKNGIVSFVEADGL